MSEFSERVKQLLASVEVGEQILSARKGKPAAEKGSPWQAGVTFDGLSGEITTKSKTSPVANWDEELAGWGFDPEIYEVIEPVRFSTWQTYDERQLWAYKAQIRSRSRFSASELDLLTLPVKRNLSKPKDRPTGSYTLVLPIGDWQIGKDDGDGLEGTVARIEASFDSVLNRVKFLRKAGYEIGHLLVASLGDLGEGCSGHYEQQTFSVALDRRDQNKVVRRLARNALMKWATEFEFVTVAAVAGNHGENRRGSKSYTTTNDNDDVAIWEAVAETLSVRPDLYGHINWHLPQGELSISVQVGSKIIGLAHGHQARSGDIVKWWQGQALGNRAVADADILLTGHFHHTKCVEVSKGRWHIQCPSMDGGSNWFEESAGKGSTAGQLTFLVSNNGWTEFAVI